MIPENSEIFTPAELPTDPAETAPELLDALRQQFPVLAEFKPLKIGIHKDIIAALPNVDRAALKLAMHWHVTRHRYLKNLAKGGDRFGLDGQPAGEITEEHRAGRVARFRRKKAQPATAPAGKLDAAPEAPPTPEAPIAVPTPGRPILRLKPKAGPVVAVSVARRVQP